MNSTRRKMLLLIGSGILLTGYLGFYFLNAAFGGYDPHYNSDGRNRIPGSLLYHDCIMWQPRFGAYYNEYRHDLIGLIFYPLLQLDRRFLHKTHSIGDTDFPEWWESLTAADIHPDYRSDFENKGTKKLKK